MNKMKRQLHRVFALLLGCVLLCCPAFAEESCSLRVNILDTEQNGIAGFNVELCPITTVDNGEHRLLPEFEGLGITTEEFATLNPQHAEDTYQYMMVEGLSGTEVTTDRNGVANFGTLEKGIYLVYDFGDQIYTFPPYLVELPAQAPSGTLYHVNSAPKTVSADSHAVWVFVEWLDDDNAAGKRPESMEVMLLRQEAMRLRAAAPTADDTLAGGEGLPFRSVVLNEKCHWQHTFHMLPHGGTYSVEGSQVPDYTLVEIMPVMEGFVLVYEYTPSPEPPNPPGPGPGPGPGPFFPDYPGSTPSGGEETLPQTGFRLLPVYALLGVGSLLVVLGLVDLCTKKRETP